MTWSSIVKKNQKQQEIVYNKDTNKIKKNIKIDVNNDLNKKDIIDYTSEEIFDFWYTYDAIDFLNNMEEYTYSNSYRILNNRKKNLSYNFINLIKDNIDLDNTKEYLNWIKTKNELIENELEIENL
tara:strand:+ start:104 stop:481 length:378 start_codon:yes stop_codon:yes gene_type:complete